MGSGVRVNRPNCFAFRPAILFLASLCCGALLFFGAVGARTVLERAGSRYLGGAVNRALLDALDVTTFIVIAALSLLLFLDHHFGDGVPLPIGWLARLLVVAFAGALASFFVITPEMVSIRDQMPVAIDLMEKGHPLRQAWGRLHGLSSLALLVRILALIGVFVLASGRQQSGSDHQTEAAP
jgi:hypothetical protein